MSYLAWNHILTDVAYTWCYSNNRYAVVEEFDTFWANQRSEMLEGEAEDASSGIQKSKWYYHFPSHEEYFAVGLILSLVLSSVMALLLLDQGP